MSIFKFANDVLATLASNVSVGASSISVSTETGINNPPPDPDGGIAAVTLVDDLANPTKNEIIYYTGRTGEGPYTLTGCMRGREGTDDQSWLAGNFIFQATTVGTMYGPFMHPQTIEQDMHVPAGYNAALVGPVGPAEGKEFTVAEGANLVILGELT